MRREPISGLTAFRRFVVYQGPAVVWALIIFAGSSIPSQDLPRIIILAPDKLLHMSVFFVFGILLHRALVFQEKVPWLQQHPVVAPLLIAAAYGVFDELHQHFVPGRSLDPYDVLADIIGACLGVWMLTVFRNRKKKRREQLSR